MTTHQDQWVKVCEPTLKRIEGKLDNVLEWINGNGDGAKVRLDRLEQSRASMRRMLAGVWSGVGAAMAGVFWLIFRN